MKKYIVGICDDEPKWCEHAKQLILKYASKIGRGMEIRVFSSDEEILHYGGESINAVFIDIQLEEESGIDGYIVYFSAVRKRKRLNVLSKA